MKNKLITIILVGVAVFGHGQTQPAKLNAPYGLEAHWKATPTPTTHVQLKWQNVTWSGRPAMASIFAYVIQRKALNHSGTSITTAWSNVGYKLVTDHDAVEPNKYSYEDDIPTTPVTLHTFFYRVRPVQASISGGSLVISAYGEPAEVAIQGAYGSPVGLDTDADGLDDDQEYLYQGLTAAQAGQSVKDDWADGTADWDGDRVPNAWEATFPYSNQSVGGEGAVSAIVDASATQNLTAVPPVFTSIHAALNNTTELNVNGTGSLVNPPYKLIYVRPGLYVENIETHVNYQFALVRAPDPNKPSQALQTVELRASTSDPLITATTTLVMDGFVLTRGPGTTGPILDVAQSATATDYLSARPTQVRLVNCLIRGAETSASSLVENKRSRVILSHCTFWMNSCASLSTAHTCGTGGALISSGTAAAVTTLADAGIAASTIPPNHYLQTTARYVVHNCIIWNPINTQVPEFYTQAIMPEIVGDSLTIPASIVYGIQGENGMPSLGYDAVGKTLELNLTPLGYPRGPANPAPLPYTTGTQPVSHHVFGKAYSLGTLKVTKDMFNGSRGDTIGRNLLSSTYHESFTSLTPFSHDIGFVQWRDDDNDGIPWFADTNNSSGTHASQDSDADGYSDLQEYFSGTSTEAADSSFVTMAQAENVFTRLFTSSSGSYTKTEIDNKVLGLQTQINGLNNTLNTTINSVFDTNNANSLLSQRLTPYLKIQDANNLYWKKGQVILVPAAGDLSMGNYTQGTQPPPATP